MPARPLTICPKCKQPWDGEACACGNKKRAWGWREDRGTRKQRGYDDAWLKLRVAYLVRQPWCEDCLREGRSMLAQQVHHRTGFAGTHDPKRLDWNNLEALCGEHHRLKTRKSTYPPQDGAP